MHQNLNEVKFVGYSSTINLKSLCDNNPHEVMLNVTSSQVIFTVDGAKTDTASFGAGFVPASFSSFLYLGGLKSK